MTRIPSGPSSRPSDAARWISAAFAAATGARLADVCVLPAPGETVWWRERGRFGMRFRGHHGGLTPAEVETVVASLVVD